MLVATTVAPMVVMSVERSATKKAEMKDSMLVDWMAAPWVDRSVYYWVVPMVVQWVDPKVAR